MYAIPIPPIHHVPEIMNEERMHLVLAHIYALDNQYAQYYRSLRYIHKQAQVILDNGAYELGKSIAAKDLFEIARDIRAHEVAMPDVLRDRKATLEATYEGLRVFEEECKKAKYIGPRIMLIPQGASPEDWGFCLFKMVHLYLDRYSYTPTFHGNPLVIGVPKWTSEFPGGRHRLIESYVKNVVDDLRIPVQVHCLGWENNLWEITRIARDFPWIRSTDSAKPFRFAAADRNIFLGEEAPEYKHGADYFDWKLTDQQILRAKTNLHIYRQAAAGVTKDLVSGVEYAG